MNKLTTTILMASLSFYAHSAVHISHDGKAEAMIVPYYTVANGLTTLLTIDNTTEDFKAIKVHLREARKGDAIYSFNLYLAPKDMWAAGIVDNNGIVNILTSDLSCVFNLNNLQGPPPQTPEGSWEWQTGSLEIIEMGVVDTSQLPTMNDQNRCQVLQDAWESQGPNSLWRSDGSNAMLPASGGLQSHVSVLNVERGFSFDVPVTHLNHFYPTETIDNQPPESSQPDLNSGDNTSLLIFDGQAITTDWPTGYEAISALLTKTTLENEYESNPLYGATTEWVISFPTARYHLYYGENSDPFVNHFENNIAFPADYSFGWYAYDRESWRSSFQCLITCPPIPPGQVNHFVNTFVLNTENEFESDISGNSRENVMSFNDFNFSYLNSGKLELLLTGPNYSIGSTGTDHNTNEEHRYDGLPVVGFKYQKYINANAQPGLLATYATSNPHTGNRHIEIISAQE